MKISWKMKIWFISLSLSSPRESCQARSNMPPFSDSYAFPLLAEGPQRVLSAFSVRAFHALLHETSNNLHYFAPVRNSSPWHHPHSRGYQGWQGFTSQRGSHLHLESSDHSRVRGWVQLRSFLHFPHWSDFRVPQEWGCHTTSWGVLGSRFSLLRHTA